MIFVNIYSQQKMCKYIRYYSLSDLFINDTYHFLAVSKSLI